MKLIIIGCGRWGSNLAAMLSQQGHTLAVVDKDPKAFERLGPKFSGTTVPGIGFDREVLLQAGIERADGLAAVTASDEANVVTARIARQVFRVPRVVARMHDPRQAEMYRRLGLQTINPVTWGTSRVAEVLCYSQLDTVSSLGSGEVDVMEAEIPPLLVGRTVNELTLAGEAQVIAINRNGKTFLPILDTIFRQNDQVYLSVLAASADRVRTLLGTA